MPGRALPLVNDQIYHVFNRGIDHRPTFTSKKEYERALLTLTYYHFVSPPVKLAHFLKLSNEDRQKIMLELHKQNNRLVEIISYCLMPNHFHLLLKQKTDKGISKFLSQFQNSFTRYSNTKHERVGPLFLDQFKAVRIVRDEQLLHVSRYIHLNPLTSYVIKEFIDLENYPWSSFMEYLGKSNLEICEKDLILNFFKSNLEFKKFTQDQVNYQRELHKIKHLTLE